MKVGRIQNFKLLVAGDGARPEHDLLGLEYFCFEGDGLWNASDAELIALAKKELAQIGLAEPRTTSRTAAWCARRRPIRSTTTSYKATSRRSARSWTQNFPTLHLVGRNGMHKYNNQDHAMMTAMLTRREHRGRRDRLRRLERQRGRRVPRGRRGRCAQALGSVRLVPRRVAAARAEDGPVAIDRPRPGCGASSGIARLAEPDRALIAVVPQLSRYTLVSALALVLDFTVYLALTTRRMSPPLAGAIGYALGIALHYLLSARFVFDARATDKVQARLFGEFALSGLAGMGITALVIALATRARRAGGSAGQGAGRRRELPGGVRAAAHRRVLAAQLRRRGSTRSRSGLRDPAPHLSGALAVAARTLPSWPLYAHVRSHGA